MAQLIQVKNIATMLSDTDLEPILAAIAAQVNEDVRSVWDTPLVILSTIDSDSDWSPDAWRFTVADTPEQVNDSIQELGEHDQVDGVPTGYAFIKLTVDSRCQPSVTISHEIVEMVGDPLFNLRSLWSSNSQKIYLACELCDPVEDDTSGYIKNGQLVSDFVTPSYFDEGSMGPWDWRNKLDGPNTLGPNGYQLSWNQATGTVQNTAAGARARLSSAFWNCYSRRARRAARLANVVTEEFSRKEMGYNSQPVSKPIRRPIVGRWALLTILFVGLLVASGVWILSGHGAAAATPYIPYQWISVEAILLGLCVLAGYAVNRRPDGILIDEQNRISLSRAQWVAWLIVLLGGFFTESMWNIAAGFAPHVGSGKDAFSDVVFPFMQPDLYALLGIVSGSVVTSGLIVNQKKNAPNAPPSPSNPRIGQPTHEGLIDANVSPIEASWADIYLGEEVANRDTVDISRLQQLVITVLLVTAYVQMLWGDLVGNIAEHPAGHFGFDKMPQVDSSFLWLLGISHAAYLSYKAAPKAPGRGGDTSTIAAQTDGSVG